MSDLPNGISWPKFMTPATRVGVTANRGVMLTQARVDEAFKYISENCRTQQEAILYLFKQGWSTNQMRQILVTKNGTPTPPQHINAVLAKFRSELMSSRPGQPQMTSSAAAEAKTAEQTPPLTPGSVEELRESLAESGADKPETPEEQARDEAEIEEDTGERQPEAATAETAAPATNRRSR